MSKETVISKGKYRLPQLEGMISVKQYLLVRNEEGQKSLLLRFFNDRNEECTGFSFELYCQDARGNIIDKQLLETENASIKGKSMFTCCTFGR